MSAPDFTERDVEAACEALFDAKPRFLRMTPDQRLRLNTVAAAIAQARLEAGCEVAITYGKSTGHADTWEQFIAEQRENAEEMFAERENLRKDARRRVGRAPRQGAIGFSRWRARKGALRMHRCAKCGSARVWVPTHGWLDPNTGATDGDEGHDGDPYCDECQSETTLEETEEAPSEEGGE